MQIESQRQGFVVFVNNEKVHEFAHRADPGSIALIEVRGEVSLQLVREHTNVCSGNALIFTFL